MHTQWASVNAGKTNIYRIGNMRARNSSEFVLHDTSCIWSVYGDLLGPTQNWFVTKGTLFRMDTISISLVLCEIYLFPDLKRFPSGTRWNDPYKRDRIRVSLYIIAGKENGSKREMCAISCGCRSFILIRFIFKTERYLARDGHLSINN